LRMTEKVTIAKLISLVMVLLMQGKLTKSNYVKNV